jgi:hypothetical protein
MQCMASKVQFKVYRGAHIHLPLGSSASDRSAVPRPLYLGVTLSANGREARERG